MHTPAVKPAHAVVLPLLAAATFLATAALGAQQTAEPLVRLAGEATLDLTSRYVFRGYEMDALGTVLQPSATVTYTLLSRPGTGLSGLTAWGSAWSSVHAGTRIYPGDLGWFEVDLSLGLSAELAKGWSADVVYTSYLAPDDAFEGIHEVGVEIGWEGFGRPGTLAFSPRAFLAQELRDGGGSEDTYLELGGDLELPTTGVVHWGVPLTVGFSVDGFYVNETGGNEAFGFVGSGLEARINLLDLGVRRVPGGLIAAVDATLVNRDAGLSHNALHDVLWAARFGFAVAF